MYADLYKDGIFIPPSIEYHYDWRFNFPGPCSNQNWVPWTIATGYGKYYGMPDGLIGQTYSAKVTITGIDPDGLPFQVTSSTICLGKEGIPQQVDLFLKNQSGGDITSENFIYHYTDPDWRSLIVPNTNSVWLSLDEYEFLWTNNSLYGEPVQKYHHWNNDETNILNYSANLIDEQTDQISSHLDFTYPATIKMNLAGHENGKIRFKDPWIADGDVIGEFIRNRGNEAVWHGYNSPLAIQATEEDLIRGVFLEQSGPPFWNPPFYSVRVPEDTIIPFHNQNITWYFQNWSGTGVQFQNASTATTPLVFQSANAVAQANYKGHLVSKEPNPTAYNNSRKIVKTGADTYQLVYEDNGEIWFTTSTDVGSEWTPEIRISPAADANTTYSNPAIACYYDISIWKYYVVWSTNVTDGLYGDYSYLSFRKFNGSAWESTIDLPYCSVGTYYFSRDEIRPAIYGGENTIQIAWRSKSIDDDIVRDHVVHYSSGSWYDPAIVPNATGHPAIDHNNSGTHLVWSDDDDIFLNVGIATGNSWEWIDEANLTENFASLRSNSQPSICCTSNEASIVWQAYHTKFRKNVVLHSDSKAELVTTFASSNTISYQNPSVARDIPDLSQIRLAFESTGSSGQILDILGDGSSWLFPPVTQGEGVAPALSKGANSLLLYTAGSSAPYLIIYPGSGISKPGDAGYAYARSLNYPFRSADISGFCEIELDLSSFPIDSTSLQDETEFLQTPLFMIGDQQEIELNYTISLTNADLPDSIKGTLEGVEVVLMDGANDLPVRTLKRQNISDYLTTARDSTLYFSLQIDLSGLENRIFYLQIKPVVSGSAKSSRVQVFLADSQTGMPKPDNVKPEQIRIIPDTYTLYPVYPNPFNPTTNIAFDLPGSSPVKIIVYSATGEKVQELVNAVHAAGRHVVQFNGSNLASGLYFCEMRSGNFQQVQKMLLVK